MTNKLPTRPERRAFLKNGTLIMTAAVSSHPFAGANEDELTLDFAMVTDLHFADKPSAGSRHYRESLDKLAEAANKFGRRNTAFAVELGDFIDAADTVSTELGYLKRINGVFSSIQTKRHYVLGNHCVYTLTKQEFLDGVNQAKSYYSFDSGEFHFVVLDSCFRSDGAAYERKNFDWTDPNIPPLELEWLKADLRENNKKTIVFAHQRLDVGKPYGVKNAATVRKILEESGNVLAVFQGHSHKNSYQAIGGIHFCTLVAMVEGSGIENNGYSVVSLSQDGTIRVDGFRQQSDYSWT